MSIHRFKTNTKLRAILATVLASIPFAPAQAHFTQHAAPKVPVQLESVLKEQARGVSFMSVSCTRDKFPVRWFATVSFSIGNQNTLEQTDIALEKIRQDGDYFINFATSSIRNAISTHTATWLNQENNSSPTAAQSGRHTAVSSAATRSYQRAVLSATAAGSSAEIDLSGTRILIEELFVGERKHDACNSFAEKKLSQM